MHAGDLLANDEASSTYGSEVRHEGKAEDAYAGVLSDGLPTDGHSSNGTTRAGSRSDVRLAIEGLNITGPI
jgi:hypothetical protein